MATTYVSYLKLDELLSLQQPRPGELEHDETLFVIIHQVYELWFKEVLHELDYLQHLLRSNNTPIATATLKRILTILKTLVAQIEPAAGGAIDHSFASASRIREQTSSGFSAESRDLRSLGLRNRRLMRASMARCWVTVGATRRKNNCAGAPSMAP